MTGHTITPGVDPAATLRDAHALLDAREEGGPLFVSIATFGAVVDACDVLVARLTEAERERDDPGAFNERVAAIIAEREIERHRAEAAEARLVVATVALRDQADLWDEVARHEGHIATDSCLRVIQETASDAIGRLDRALVEIEAAEGAPE